MGGRVGHGAAFRAVQRRTSGLAAAIARQESRSMPDSTDHGPTFAVSEYQDDGLWHEVLTTQDEVKANDLVKELGDRGQIEQIPPRPTNEARAAAAMADKPKPGAVYVVYQLQDGQWRELLVTTHESTARHAQEAGRQGPVGRQRLRRFAAWQPWPEAVSPLIRGIKQLAGAAVDSEQHCFQKLDPDLRSAANWERPYSVRLFRNERVEPSFDCRS